MLYSFFPTHKSHHSFVSIDTLIFNSQQQIMTISIVLGCLVVDCGDVGLNMNECFICLVACLKVIVVWFIVTCDICLLSFYTFLPISQYAFIIVSLTVAIVITSYKVCLITLCGLMFVITTWTYNYYWYPKSPFIIA